MTLLRNRSLARQHSVNAQQFFWWRRRFRLRLPIALVLLAFAATAFAQNNTMDANQLMSRGAQLIQSKPAEAVKLLQQALRLNPELPALRYQLGLAFHAI